MVINFYRLFVSRVVLIVVLFVMGSCCSKRSDEIRNNLLPTASFLIEETKLYVGQEIGFADNASDQDGETVRWEWNFGDGSVSGKQNPIHTYNADGEFTVTLFVKDSDNDTDLLSKTIVVLPAGQRIKVVKYNIDAGVSFSGVFDLKAIADVVNTCNPDYVALQKVDLNTEIRSCKKKSTILLFILLQSGMLQMFRLFAR